MLKPLLFLLLATFAQGVFAAKSVALVYDDSGSMESKATHRWVPANYAVQVLAAMGGEADQLFVVRMSKPTIAQPFSGTQGIDTLLREFSQQVPPKDANTPYQSVRTAINALAASDAGEKWLLVLTDGAFSEEEDHKTAVEPTVREDIELAVRRLRIHAAFLIIQQPPHRVDGLWQAEGGAVRFQAASDTEIPAKMEEAADLLNARSSLKSNGVGYVARGSELHLSSRFPLRHLIVLRQDSEVGKLVEASDATGQPLRLRQHEVRAIRPTRALPAAHITHIDSGGVIHAGEDIIRLRFDGATQNMRFKLLPEVAVRFEASLKDPAGKALQPDASGLYQVCAGDSVRFETRLLDDAGQPVTAGRADIASFKVGVDVGSQFQPQSLDTPGAVFSLLFTPQEETVLRGMAEYPGYFHFQTEPLRLRPVDCSREVRLTVEGDGVWRGEVNRVEKAPYLKISATLDGKPVPPEEFAHWQLNSEGDPGGALEWRREGQAWQVRPKTACCAWWPGRAKVGETSVRLKLATPNPRDRINLPPPLRFAVEEPSDPSHALWWLACPFAVPLLALALLVYLRCLLVKQRFAKKACLWAQHGADRRVRSHPFRREASWLMRWFWPSRRESVNIGGLRFFAMGSGYSVLVSGRSLGEYHEINNWRYDERAKQLGKPQPDARVNDKADIVLKPPGVKKRDAYVYRYQYSRDGTGPVGWE